MAHTSAAARSGPYVASGHIKSGLPTTIDKMIPDAMKACLTGWKEDCMEKKKFTGITSKSYDEKYLRDSLLHSYIHAATTISTISGLNMTASNTLNYLVSGAVFAMLVTNTTQ